MKKYKVSIMKDDHESLQRGLGLLVAAFCEKYRKAIKDFNAEITLDTKTGSIATKIDYKVIAERVKKNK